MEALIGTKLAGIILLVLFFLLIVFHVLILFKLLPAGMAWGGQAGNSPSRLRGLEIASLVLTILFMIAVAAKIGFIHAGGFAKTINIFLWIIFTYLILNTVGNLASRSSMEKWIFAPITVVAALLVLRLVVEK